MARLHKISFAIIFIALFTACTGDSNKPQSELTSAKEIQATEEIIAEKIAVIHQLQNVADGNNKTIQDLEKEVATLNATNKEIEFVLDNMNATNPQEVEKTIKKIVELTQKNN